LISSNKVFKQSVASFFEQQTFLAKTSIKSSLVILAIFLLKVI